MTQFKLTTWERIALCNVLGEIRGNLATLRRANTAMNALELSPGENEEVGFNTITTPRGEVVYQWLDQERAFEIEIADPEALALLRQAAQQYEGWGIADLDRAEALLGKLAA
jgi:hypothetical protein